MRIGNNVTGKIAALLLAAVAIGGCDNQSASSPQKAAPEASELRIGRQIGIAYLLLYVMEDKKLIEKYAKQEGIDDLKVTFRPIGSPAVINDSILGDNLDIGSAGIVPFLVLWDKTKGSPQAVRMFGAVAMQPMVMTTNRPDLKTFADLTENDRIAVPAIKTSINAMVLSMAAEKFLGPDKIEFVDKLQVPFSHADAVVTLLSGQSSITAHMATMPFFDQALEDPKIHRVFSSNDVTDGPSSISGIWARESFYEKNPRIMRAVYAALKEADTFIQTNPEEAARIYVKIDKSKLSPEFITKLIKNPEVSYTLTPKKVSFLANWLHKHGRLRNKAGDWKEFFFQPAHALPGS